MRPAIDAPVFRDADGRVIDYGDRWKGGSPPRDTYSVDTHPERFAPLHTVADALVAYLCDTYDVEVTEGDEAANELIDPTGFDVTRAVRVAPNRPASAALTFAFTAYPGVVVHAGALHDFAYPFCGCDACDETWQSQADALERCVFAVVGGHYRESVGLGPGAQVGHRLEFPEGSASGWGEASGIPAARRRAARRALREVPEGWAAWPRRGRANGRANESA